VRHRDYRHYQGKRVTVAAPGVTAYADGERIATLPLTVEVAPAALKVLVP
jgi:diacylglycerol kinase (ATP)